MTTFIRQTSDAANVELRLLANIGDEVTKGQVVAELEKADLEATVAQHEAELQLAAAKLSAVENLLPMEIQKAEFDMSRWQATRTLCEQDISRELRLLESDATSQQSSEQAQERLAVAKTQLASAEKAYELAKARYEEDRKQASAEVDRCRGDCPAVPDGGAGGSGYEQEALNTLGNRKRQHEHRRYHARWFPHP